MIENLKKIINIQEIYILISLCCHVITISAGEKESARISILKTVHASTFPPFLPYL